MTTVGERKCALLLASFAAADRRRLLRKLPRESARRLSALVRELETLRLPLDELAGDLLVDDVRGLTAGTSLGLDQLVLLASKLSPAWFARTLASWTEVDRAFCLSMLPRENAAAIALELDRAPMPPRLIAAMREESAALAGSLSGAQA